MPSRFAEQFLSARGSIVSLKEDVYENMCQYWAYSDWRKFLTKGHKNARASTSPIRGNRATRNRAGCFFSRHRLRNPVLYDFETRLSSVTFTSIGLESRSGWFREY